MDESLPCPVCGGRAWANYEPTTIRIHCPCCDILGPEKATIEEARAAWNALPRSLAWADEPPKVPGWYWCRDENDKENARIIFPNIRKTKWRDKQWAGPIPEPKEQGRHDE